MTTRIGNDAESQSSKVLQRSKSRMLLDAPPEEVGLTTGRPSFYLPLTFFFNLPPAVLAPRISALALFIRFLGAATMKRPLCIWQTGRLKDKDRYAGWVGFKMASG